MNCPNGLSNEMVKKGSLNNGKPRYKGKNCRRQGVLNPRKSQIIVGVARGDRSFQTALSLWNSLPGVYRQGAVSYTDFGLVYPSIFSTTRHRALGKESGQTNPIERFNCTLRYF